MLSNATNTEHTTADGSTNQCRIYCMRDRLFAAGFDSKERAGFVKENAMSNEDEEDSEARFRAAVYPELEKKYTKQLHELFKCCFGGRTIDQTDRNNFLWEFDEIVGPYKKRLADPEYFGRMSRCQMSLARANELLQDSIDKLAEIDANHLLLMLKVFDEAVPTSVQNAIAGQKGELGWMDMRLILKRAQLLSGALSVCLMAAGAPELLEQKRRGHPSLPYMWATFELINFFESWSDREVPFAKTIPKKEVSGGQLDHPACQFIYIALSLIDPKVTPAKAVTSINNARRWRASINEKADRLGEKGIRGYFDTLMETSEAITSAE
jgi:hypothetical protein